MKKVIVLFAILVSNFAFAGILDGKSYCRSVVSDGMFGQPKGTRLHCITFADGVATDGANSFFGNPPERAEYEVKMTEAGRKVTFGNSEYALSRRATSLISITGSTVAGTILKLKK